jgi:hypothetical protein
LKSCAFAALALSLCGPPKSQAGVFLPGSPMLTVRCNHTATLLPNGKVLVAGGDMTGTAELYDPATGNWTATGAMSTARSHHAAVLLNNGKVLVVGGGRKTEWIASPETELYDPATGKWRLTGALHTGSFFFTTATLLPDGKVLATGDQEIGVDLASKATFEERAAQRVTQEGPSTSEIYDPATETWAKTLPMKTTFRWPTATLLKNGQVLLAGAQTPGALHSRDGNGKLLGGRIGLFSGNPSGAELYNPASGEWKTISNAMSMIDNRFHTTTLLFNGKALFVGEQNDLNPDSSDQIFDPAGGTWSAAASMTEQRGDHTATVLRDGKVLAVGGFGKSQAGRLQLPPGHRDTLSSAELYDPVSGRWTLLPSHLATGRLWHTATLLPDGEVLIAGGHSPNGPISSTEIYDPEYDKETPLR